MPYYRRSMRSRYPKRRGGYRRKFKPNYTHDGKYIPYNSGQAMPTYAPVTITPRAVMHYSPLTSSETNTQWTSAASPYVFLLNGVDEGDGIHRRETNRFMMQKLILRWSNANPSGTMLSVNRLGFAIIYDTQPTGALPIWSDVFDLQKTNSMTQISGRDRFQILYRYYNILSNKVYWNGATAIFQTTDDGRSMEGEITVNVSRMTVFNPDTSTGGIADIKRGALYLMFLGDETTTAAYQCGFFYRLSFYTI